jgi:SNF2 family DNA or RNA helicase
VCSLQARLQAKDANVDKVLGIVQRIHWLRIILDEGHLLGSQAMTNRLANATKLRAERRWVLTGTPTPATAAGQVFTARASYYY